MQYLDVNYINTKIMILLLLERMDIPDKQTIPVNTLLPPRPPALPKPLKYVPTPKIIFFRTANTTGRYTKFTSSLLKRHVYKPI